MAEQLGIDKLKMEEQRKIQMQMWEDTNYAAQVEQMKKDISGGREKVSVDYKSDLERGSLIELLNESFERESRLGYTTVGVHRDELLFGMNGEQIRKVGSQGQQKSFLISLNDLPNRTNVNASIILDFPLPFIAEIIVILCRSN